MQTDTVSADMAMNTNSMSKDPVLLGVSLPLSVTMSAATQVANAWAKAAVEVMNAAKAMASEKKAMVAKKASEAAS